MSIALVTDSTAYLPPAMTEGLTIVPLQVVVDGRSFDEGEKLSSADVAEALRRSRSVSTSRAAPELFARTYSGLVDGGATGIVSLHLSAALSGTYESAVVAARDAGVPVEVVDTATLGMGLGYAVSSALAAVLDGASVADAAAVGRARANASRVYFSLHTLDHLRRGGRIGAAQALIGSALSVKPLLSMRAGRIVPLENVRTSTRALARLRELALDAAGLETVDVAVHHLAAPERAEQLASELADRVPSLGDLVITEVGPVIGAHVGPGMVAVVVAPRV